MNAMTDDWQNLASHAVRRRDELGLRQEDVRVPGLSTATITKIENAAQCGYRRATLRTLEVALGWASGSVDAILAGGEPTLSGGVAGPATASASGVVSDPGASRLDVLEREMSEVRRSLREVERSNGEVRRMLEEVARRVL